MQIKARVLVAAALGLAPGLVLASCGSDADGAGSDLLSPIQPTSYVTLEPPTTSTTLPASPTGDPAAGGISPSEQSHTVVGGDSVYKIANLFKVDPEVLANFNEWTDGIQHKLLVGDVVRIPPNSAIPSTSGGSAEAGGGGATGDAATGDAATGDETAAAEETGSGEAASGGGCTHTIVAGENPSKVAKKYDITLDQLQAANAGSNVLSTFLVGQELKIPPEGDC